MQGFLKAKSLGDFAMTPAAKACRDPDAAIQEALDAESEISEESLEDEADDAPILAPKPKVRPKAPSSARPPEPAKAIPPSRNQTSMGAMIHPRPTSALDAQPIQPAVPAKSPSAVQVPKLLPAADVPKPSAAPVPASLPEVGVPRLPSAMEVPELASAGEVPELASAVEVPELASAVEVPELASAVEAQGLPSAVGVPKHSAAQVGLSSAVQAAMPTARKGPSHCPPPPSVPQPKQVLKPPPQKEQPTEPSPAQQDGQAKPSIAPERESADRRATLYSKAMQAIGGFLDDSDQHAVESELAKSLAISCRDRGPRGPDAPEYWRGQKMRPNGRYGNRGGGAQKKAKAMAWQQHWQQDWEWQQDWSHQQDIQPDWSHQQGIQQDWSHAEQGSGQQQDWQHQQLGSGQQHDWSHQQDLQQWTEEQLHDQIMANRF